MSYVYLRVAILDMAEIFFFFVLIYDIILLHRS